MGKKNKFKSERIFGVLFFTIFLIFSFYPLFDGKSANKFFIVVSLFFLIVTILKPNYLTKSNNLWIKFGNLLNKIISPIILLSIYLLVVFPTGIFLRCFNQDPLELKFNKKIKTYWKNKSHKNNDFSKQF